MSKNIAVYQILNKINGKMYIGSSIHLNKRINDHLCMLRTNKHENCYLQHAYNKYGVKNFEINILEYGSCKSDIRVKEQKWIDKLNVCNPENGYNINRLANGGSLPGKYSNNYGNRGAKNPLSRQIAQIDSKSKKVIRIWGSLREAKRNLNINITHIGEICDFFANRKLLKLSKGYGWCYVEDINKIENSRIFTYKDRKPVLDHSKKARPKSLNGMAREVVQLALDNTFINKYKSIVEAAELNNINANVIYNQLFRKPKHPKNYRWLYLKDYKKMKVSC